MKTIDQDREIIDTLGGVAKIAERLGYPRGRVQQWVYRGIPAGDRHLVVEMLNEKGKPTPDGFIRSLPVADTSLGEMS